MAWDIRPGRIQGQVVSEDRGREVIVGSGEEGFLVAFESHCGNPPSLS